MARYTLSVKTLDEKMGIVLDALRASGLEKDTLVVCTTDHGIPFPRMKCTLTDDGIGVYLIMRGPHGFSGGRLIDALVSHVDIYPTLCECAGIDPPTWLEGKSLLPLIRGDTEEINERIFAEVTYHAAYEPQRCTRSKRWKYIRRYDGRSGPVLPNCDDGESKTALFRHGWFAVEEEALFDLLYDPHETCNLARDPRYASDLSKERRSLREWMERTADPLLGPLPVPAPIGAKVNSPDGYSPSEKSVGG